MSLIGRSLGLGVILSMQNRLSGPAAAASASLGTLSAATERATVDQMRFQAAMTAGRTALIGAAGLSVALGLVVSEAAKFEEGLNRVEAILVPTTQEMKNLTEAAIEAGIKTRWTPREATEGLKELATAGFNATEAHQALMPVLDLATGSLGQLGVAEAASSASAAVRGFGLEAKDASRAVDILLRATQRSNLQARDYQKAIGLVSGQARSAGQELEHTIAVLGALRNTGQSASVSATSLQNALREMVQPQSMKLLEGLGVQVGNQKGEFRDLADIIFDVEKATKQMTEVQRFQLLQNVFGVRGMRAYNAVTSMGEKRFYDLNNELYNASGTAERFRKKVLEPLIGRLVLLWGALQTLAAQLGRPLLGPLKIIVSLFYRFITTLISLSMAFPLITKLVMLTAGLTTAILGLVGISLILFATFMKLNVMYGLVAKAKLAYFFITKMIFGMEGFTRTQILLSVAAEQLRLTQTTLMNAKMKIRLLLERLLGIGISGTTVLTWRAVHAATAERVALLGNNIAIGINNALRRAGAGITWLWTRANYSSIKSIIMGSSAMRAASAGTGLLTGAVKGLFAAMMANPILLIISLVVLFTYALYKLSQAFWNAKGDTQVVYAIILMLMSPVGILIVMAKMFSVAWQKNLGGVSTAFAQMKKAIWGIFSPLGKLFGAASEVSTMGKLFSGFMKLIMIPLAKVFEWVSFAATVFAGVLEIIVQEVQSAFAPLVPAIDELGQAFDDLVTAVFGRGEANLGFWKTFGTVVRWTVKNSLEPMVWIVTKLVRFLSLMSKFITSIIYPLKAMASYIGEIIKFGAIEWGKSWIGRGVSSLVGLQEGGIVKGPTIAALAENNRPEMVTPLPVGMQPNDFKSIFESIKKGELQSSAPRGTMRVTIENKIYLDGREIKRITRELDDIDLARSFA